MARLSDRVVTGAPNGILANDEPIQWYAADGITLIDGIKVDATDAVYLAPAGGATEVGGNLTVTGTTTGSGYLYLESKTANQGLRLNNTTKIQAWNPAGTVLRSLMQLDASEDVRIGSSANEIYLDNDTTVTGNLDVSGNIFQGTNPASAGDIRMAATSTIRNRNAANTGNITMIATNASDEVTIASSGQGTVVGGDLGVTGDLDVTSGHLQLGNGITRTESLGVSLRASGGHTAANFNPDVDGQGMIEATITGVPVGAGGGIQMGAGDKAFCAIRGYITSGNNNTAGDMVFSTRRVNTDTTLTEAGRISANGDASFASDINAVGSIESGTYSNVGATSGCKIFQTGTVTISTTSTSTINRINFYNPNGQVGRIRTTGTATQYVTSSDPRLKSEFTPITGASEMILEARDQGMIGEFTFLADPTQTIWGYNAHKLIDAQPNFGGSEGEGSRDAPLGDDVTPAGVDQSKRVPILEAAIGELLDRIKVLEEAGAK